MFNNLLNGKNLGLFSTREVTSSLKKIRKSDIFLGLSKRVKPFNLIL